MLDLSSTIVSGNRILRTLSNPTCLFSDIGIASGDANASLAGENDLIGTLVNSSLQRPPQSVGSNYPGLGSLQDNGGTTETHLPHATSWAVARGLANGCSTDQRGEPRVVGMGADSGATEPNANDIIFADGFELQ